MTKDFPIHPNSENEKAEVESAIALLMERSGARLNSHHVLMHAYPETREMQDKATRAEENLLHPDTAVAARFLMTRGYFVDHDGQVIGNGDTNKRCQTCRFWQIKWPVVQARGSEPFFLGQRCGFDPRHDLQCGPYWGCGRWEEYKG